MARSPCQPLTRPWSPRSSYDPTASESLGRHHPITFANETHGFLLGGSTVDVGAVPDLHIYDEMSDLWIDASYALADGASLSSYYPPRTYGYGVVLDERGHTKAYLGFGSGSANDEDGGRLGDWWEFDMTTLAFRELARFPRRGTASSLRGAGVRRVGDDGDGDGDGDGGWHNGLVGESLDFVNFDDFWSYSVDDDVWTRLPDFPGGRRHHPY